MDRGSPYGGGKEPDASHQEIVRWSVDLRSMNKPPRISI
jgi:hypothetical protein